MTWPVSRTWRVLTGVTPPILVLRHPGPRAVTATDAEHQLVWTLDTGHWSGEPDPEQDDQDNSDIAHCLIPTIPYLLQSATDLYLVNISQA